MISTPPINHRSTVTLSILPPESILELLHDIERLIERIVEVAVRHLALQLHGGTLDFDHLSEVIQVTGRLLLLRDKAEELMQAYVQQPGSETDGPVAEDLSELQREMDHVDAEAAQVSREVLPPLDTGE